MKLPSILVIIFLLGFSVVAHAKNETLLGVLEEPQCKDDMGTHLRVLFVNSNKSWVALSSANASAGFLPNKIDWLVALSGEKIGEVETIDPGFKTKYDWTYPRDRLFNLLPGASFPSIPNTNGSFAGWCAAPKNRPLVVVANGHVKDPDSWEKFNPSEQNVLELFPQFKSHNGAVYYCPETYPEGIDFDYGASDLHVLQSLRSKTGMLLITLGFKPRKDACGNPDDGWNSHTFIMKDTTTYVGANLTLVGAGDFNGEGNSEILFWYSGYNNDGYVLLTPSTGKRIDYLWHYH